MLRYCQSIINFISRPISRSNKIVIPSSFGPIKIGVIGTGDFSKVRLESILELSDYYQLHSVCSRTIEKAKSVADKYRALYSTTDPYEIINNIEIDAVMILTRNDSHTKLAISAIENKKAIFLEKPIAINQEDLSNFKSALRNYNKPIFIGLNRRFSPHTIKIKEKLKTRKKSVMATYAINNKNYPQNHWVRSEQGGGIILHYMCHVLDWFAYILNANPVVVSGQRLGQDNEMFSEYDNFALQIKYSDDSLVSIVHTTMGLNKIPKDTCLIYFDNSVIKNSGFSETVFYDSDSTQRYENSDMGHRKILEEFAKAIIEEKFVDNDIIDIVNMTELALKIREEFNKQDNFEVKLQ